MRHLVANVEKLMDMYAALLEMSRGVGAGDSEDSSLMDTFDYIRISWRDILRLDEDIQSPDYADHPLDSICLGVLESRSFLFKVRTAVFPGGCRGLLDLGHERRRRSLVGIKRYLNLEHFSPDHFYLKLARVLTKIWSSGDILADTLFLLNKNPRL